MIVSTRRSEDDAVVLTITPGVDDEPWRLTASLSDTLVIAGASDGDVRRPTGLSGMVGHPTPFCSNVSALRAGGRTVCYAQATLVTPSSPRSTTSGQAGSRA